MQIVLRIPLITVASHGCDWAYKFMYHSDTFVWESTTVADDELVTDPLKERYHVALTADPGDEQFAAYMTVIQERKRKVAARRQQEKEEEEEEKEGAGV